MSQNSTAARIASNAQQALSRLAEETAQLKATNEGMVSEQSALQSEFNGLFATSHELVARCEATQAEQHRAQLQFELSQDTTKEDEARMWLQSCSDRHDEALALFQEHSKVLALREPEIDSKLKYLQHCIADNVKMLAEQETRKTELQAFFDRAHAEYGAEVYRAALQELRTLQERRDLASRRAQNAETRLHDFRAHLAERFERWPALAAEVQVAHGYSVETQFTPVLQAHSNYLAALEEALPNLPYRAGQPDLFVDNVSLWGLLGINALQLRQLYGLLAVHTPESHYMKHHQIQSITQRRENLRTLMERLELAARHTTPTEAARVAKHLAEVAGELVEA